LPDPNFANVTFLTHFNDNAVDVTGNFTLAETGTVTYNPGQFGNAATFNGSSNHFEAPFSTFIEFPGDFTIEAWFNADTVNGSSLGAIVGAWEPFSTRRGFLISQNSSNKISFLMGNGGGTTVGPILTTTSITTGTWYHVAATREGSTVRLFLDGNLENSTTTAITVNSDAAGGAKLSFGKHINGGDDPDFFNGLVDDVRITKGVARYTANFAVPTAAHPDS